ncbi:MAG: DUF6265 family protein [Reichenbachiella sp.]|uniref:DUF6265 family protein n=1 Tax=Reichenbachiella sp. TaxID=2184521 RepID=UPI0032659F7B
MKSAIYQLALTLFLMITCAFQGACQTIENPDITDFGWLAGNWVGDGFGGVSQEAWTEPSAGSMIGSYKHSKEGKVTFYEILHISKIDGEFRLRLKHFNPDLTGWEEKDKFVEFPFVSATPTKIEFKGLIYELVEKDKMEIQLKLNRGGEISTEIFHFEKKSI